MVRKPANFPGLGEALIFFCFFSSIKGRKAGRETPRNSRLQPIAKKQHGVIPNYGPVSRKKYAGFLDYGSIASKRQAHFAPGSIHSQARDTEKRLPIGHTRPTRSLCLYPLPSTLYPLSSILYPLPSTLYPLYSQILTPERQRKQRLGRLHAAILRPSA